MCLSTISYCAARDWLIRDASTCKALLGFPGLLEVASILDFEVGKVTLGIWVLDLGVIFLAGDLDLLSDWAVAFWVISNYWADDILS